MIQEMMTFMLQAPVSQKSFSFDLDQVSDFSMYNSISVQNIIFPNILPQIRDTFAIQIDDVTITFYQGNISFQQVITKIQNALNVAHPNTYSCTEYLKDQYQQSNRLKINRINNASLTVTIPQNQTDFFGNLQQITDGSGNVYYLSQYQCNLLYQQMIVMRSNGCANTYQQNGHFDTLYTFQLDNTIQSGYFQQQVDVIQNKQSFTKYRTINLIFEDQNGNPITFQTNAYFYIRIAIFHWRYKMIDVFLDDLRDIVKMYAYKNFKKQIEIREDPEEDKKEIIDVMQQLQ